MNKTMNHSEEHDRNTCRYWLHRISHEADVSHRLLAGGWLSIGWSGLVGSGIDMAVAIIDDGTRDITDDDDTGEFEERYREYMPKKRSRWSLWRFLRFRPNDIVVVPLWGGKFSVYRVDGYAVPISTLGGYCDFVSNSGRRIIRGEDGLFYAAGTDEIIDLGFVVRVVPLKENLSRYEYADNALTRRMKLLQTNADITDLAENIREVIEADVPINLYAEIVEDLTGRLLDMLKRRLTPDKLEQLIAWYLKKCGAMNVYRPAKNSSDKSDGADADVIAEFDSLKIMICVQAKLHDGTTNEWAIEQVARYAEQHQRSFGEYTIVPWAVSTADTFGETAIELAQKYNVRLIAGQEFARMLIDAGITNINEAFEK